MLYIKNTRLGEVQLEIMVLPSSVDSYIIGGASLTLDRDLTEGELEEFQNTYGDLVQEYAVEEGSSWD